jgi:hypothetical protein
MSVAVASSFRMFGRPTVAVLSPSLIGRWNSVDSSLSRIFLAAESPSISGIWTSINTRSKGCVASSKRARWPLPATTTECPIFSAMRVATIWLTRLSSAKECAGLSLARAARVRSEVSWNVSSPTEVLARLATDEDDSVRRGVAKNANSS